MKFTNVIAGRLVLGISLLTLLAACAPDVSGLASHPPRRAWTALSEESAAETAETIDDLLAQVATAAPGFGGIFVDSAGSVVVLVTPTADRARVMEALQTVASGALLQAPEGTKPYSSVRYGDASFDVGELIRWRAALRSAWVDGITLVDVDERANRLRLGVRDEQSAEVLKARLATLGVPTSATEIRVMPRDVQRTALDDRFRPIPGGVREYFVYDSLGSSAACSVMANATTDLGLGYITAGHCSYQQGGSPDMTAHYQNSASTANLVGFEIADSPLHTCSENSDGGCKYADASFVGYDSASFAQLGYIARTGSPGSPFDRTIDSNYPRFAVMEPSSPASNLLVGSTIYKMGATSGWTSGSVTGTCVDVAVEGWDFSLDRYVTWMYKCHGESDLELDGGDSGSAIFTWDGSSSTVTIRGIGVVSNPSTGVMHYSKWVYINLELSLTTGSLALTN